MISVQNFNIFISSLVVLGQISVIVLLLVAIVSKFLKSESKILTFVSNKSIVLSVIVALIAVLASLYYSDVVGYDPCKLCWLQRIFIYPQLVIGIIALLLKDKKANYYIFSLSLIAFVLAFYHYLGQMGLTSLACDTIGYSVKCSERFVINFGYITIPMMALTAMAMNMTFSGISIFKK